MEKWHIRIAHLNHETLQKIIVKRVVQGTDMDTTKFDWIECLSCTAAKMERMSYCHIHPVRATGPNQKLMADINYVGVRTTEEEIMVSSWYRKKNVTVSWDTL